ncbi:MAG: hypothetical protein AB7N80_14325 [Bdellovibrionales bacterium]
MSHAEVVELPEDSPWLTPIWQTQTRAPQKPYCNHFPKRLLCYVHNKARTDKSPVICASENDEKIEQALEQAFQLLAPVVQQEICTLAAIYIHRNQPDEPWMGYIAINEKFKGQTNQHVIGLSSRLFDELGTQGQADTNKALWLFGLGSKKSLLPPSDSSLDLSFEYDSKIGDSPLFRLISTLTHEVGHRVYYKHVGSEALLEVDSRDPSVHVFYEQTKPKTFAAMSWRNEAWHTLVNGDMKTAYEKNSLRPPFHFSFFNKLCFYECKNKPIPPAQASAFWAQFRKLPFVSLYAATNPYEDFAESWTDSLLMSTLSSKCVVRLAGQIVFDSEVVEKSAHYRPKALFMKKLAKRVRIIQIKNEAEALKKKRDANVI